MGLRLSLNKTIIPWQCHICRSEYDTPGGGICSRCSRATCRTHLYKMGAKLKLDSQWVCEQCLTDVEKTNTKTKWTIRLRNLTFKRIIHREGKRKEPAPRQRRAKGGASVAGWCILQASWKRWLLLFLIPATFAQPLLSTYAFIAWTVGGFAP